MNRLPSFTQEKVDSLTFHDSNKTILFVSVLEFSITVVLRVQVNKLDFIKESP